MIAVNLTGVFLTLRDGLNQMPGWGRLISVASTAGLKGYAKVAPYAAAKHGVIGLTRSLALEIAQAPGDGECDLPRVSGYADDGSFG